MAQDAFERFSLDRVLFVPASRPPHKTSQVLAADRHRLAMLEYATEGDWRFEVCPIEIERGGTSYTIETLQQLRERDPEDALFFIIGLDSLLDLHTWKNVDELLGLCEIITIDRPGVESQTLTPRDLQLPHERASRLLDNIISGHRLDIASSDIRGRVEEGLSIRYLVPPEVEMYIAEHRLYGTYECT